MQGRRPPRPPFGWDGNEPPVSWRKRREAFGADAPELAEPPAALRYLQPVGREERAAKKRMRGRINGRTADSQ
jgi:hypothetical protein